MTSINRSVYSPAPQAEQNGNPVSQDTRDRIARSLLSESFSKSPKIIVCMSETTSTSPLCDAVGICYLASSSSDADVYSEGVHISDMLFGSKVHAFKHSGNTLPNLTAVLGSAEVSALLHLWQTFFTEHPDANLLQCFCGDAGHAVAQALQLTPYASRITVVGINSPIHIPHPTCHLFRTLPNTLEQCASREAHPDAGTIRDPAIAPALLKAFYETLMTSSQSREKFPIIAEQLQSIGAKHQVEYARFCEADIHDTDWYPDTDSVSEPTRDLWAESRLNHLLNLCLASLRVVDYIYLGLRSTTHPTSTVTPINPRRSRSLLSVASEASTLISTTTPEPTSTWAMTTTAREYPQSIYPCGIYPNGTFPGGLDPFGGTFSEGDFPYSDFFSGNLLKEIYNCTVYFDFNVTTPFPYGMSPFGVFTPENNATHIDWPYQCRGWVDPDKLDPWWMPFNYSLFFGGGLIRLEDPGETPLFPCGILPNGSFTGAFLNLTVEEEYPYGQFPSGDFPYLSYFFNSSFNYGEEYDRNPHNDTSLLVGSHDYFNSSLTVIKNCTEEQLGWLRNLTRPSSITLFEAELSGSGEGSGYYENMTYSGYGSGDTDLEWFYNLTDHTLPEGYFFYGCDWDWENETTTEGPTSTSFTHSTGQPQIAAQAQHQSIVSSAGCHRTETNRVLLLLTGYWVAQGVCEAILLRTSSRGGKRRVQAISLALTSSLIIGNFVDLASNLWDTLQGRSTNLCTSDMVIRGSLCAYDVINLTSETIRFASPSIRGIVNKVRSHSVEHLPIIEKTAEKVKEGITKVDGIYRRNARKTNLILSSAGMAVAGVVALGSGISIFANKDEYDSSTYFLTIQSLAVAAFSALFFRTYRS